MCAAKTDLFGMPLVEEKKIAKAAPVPVSRNLPEVSVPYRPCTVTRISKNEVMLVNDDCKHLFK